MQQNSSKLLYPISFKVQCGVCSEKLHTLIVTSGYLSYRCFHISFKHSDHSPLASRINKAFSPKDLSLAQYFVFFFGPFSVNPRRDRAGKSL